MKRLYKKFLPYLLSLEILLFSLFSCSITVYAVDFMPTDIIAAVEYGIENNDWEPFWRFLYNSSDGLMFLFSQMGAITTQDFVKWVNNNKALESLAETVPTPAKKEGDNIVFTQELMAKLKTLIDDYAKENQQFVVVPTYRAKDIPTSVFL